MGSLYFLPTKFSNREPKTYCTLAKKTINNRIDFSKIERIIDYPDFLDLQLQSFKDFLQIETPAEKRQNEGLFKVFAENFPISDSRENFVLEFVDYTIDPPKYDV